MELSFVYILHYCTVVKTCFTRKQDQFLTNFDISMNHQIPQNLFSFIFILFREQAVNKQWYKSYRITRDKFICWQVSFAKPTLLITIKERTAHFTRLFADIST